MLIEISNRQSLVAVDEAVLKTAVERVLVAAGITSGEISLAVVNDPAIHALNRQYLAHDYATDVLSFVLERDGSRLDGEIIVSAETAQRVAAQFGSPPQDELLLYVIHGALHLAGYDDQTPEAQIVMREQERLHLAGFGLDRAG